MKGKMQPKGKLIRVEDRRYVDRLGKPKRKFKVNPAVTNLRNGEDVTIVYEGLKGGVVMIPVAGVFARQVHHLPPGKGSCVKMKVLKTAPRGTFSFAVLCYGLEDDFAEGASPPKMTITDPKRGPN